MLISKNHLRARHSVSKDESRPMLNVIDINREGDEVVAVATDGYILTEVRETTLDPAEFPEINGSPSINHIRVQGATADKIKVALKPSKTLPILGYANVTSTGIVTTNLERSTIFNDRQVEGKFPDYKQLIPEETKAKARVTLNPDKLAAVLKAFEGVGAVTLELHDGKFSPVVIRADQDDFEITGVVMPLKV